MTNDFVNRYIEIQYHGELTLDDVDYIVFDRNRLHNDIGVETEKLLSKAKFLADKGIKILKICNYSSETNKNKILRFDKDHIDWREV